MKLVILVLTNVVKLVNIYNLVLFLLPAGTVKKEGHQCKYGPENFILAANVLATKIICCMRNLKIVLYAWNLYKITRRKCALSYIVTLLHISRHFLCRIDVSCCLENISRQTVFVLNERDVFAFTVCIFPCVSSLVLKINVNSFLADLIILFIMWGLLTNVMDWYQYFLLLKTTVSIINSKSIYWKLVPRKSSHIFYVLCFLRHFPFERFFPNSTMPMITMTFYASEC